MIDVSVLSSYPKAGSILSFLIIAAVIFNRLWAVVTIFHSLFTFSNPLRRNCLNPFLDFGLPNFAFVVHFSIRGQAAHVPRSVLDVTISLFLYLLLIRVLAAGLSVSPCGHVYLSLCAS